MEKKEFIIQAQSKRADKFLCQFIPILLVLTAFFIEHKDYIFDLETLRDLGFFYLLFCPFDYGLMPIILPIAISMSSIGCFLQTQKNSQTETTVAVITRPVYMIIVSYLILIVLSFALSGGNTGTYNQLAIGHATEKLVFRLSGIPYLAEVMISLCIGAILWGLLSYLILCLLQDRLVTIIISSLLFIAMDALLPNLSLGKFKPYCQIYTWLGSTQEYWTKYLIQFSCIALSLLIYMFSPKHLSKIHSNVLSHMIFPVKNVVISCSCGILCGISHQYLFIKDINILEILIATLGGYIDQNVGMYSHLFTRFLLTAICMYMSLKIDSFCLIKSTRAFVTSEIKILSVCFLNVFAFSMGIALLPLLRGSSLAEFKWEFELSGYELFSFACILLVISNYVLANIGIAISHYSRNANIIYYILSLGIVLTLIIPKNFNLLLSIYRLSMAFQYTTVVENHIEIYVGCLILLILAFVAIASYAMTLFVQAQRKRNI